MLQPVEQPLSIQTSSPEVVRPCYWIILSKTVVVWAFSVLSLRLYSENIAGRQQTTVFITLYILGTNHFTIQMIDFPFTWTFPRLIPYEKRASRFNWVLLIHSPAHFFSRKNTAYWHITDLIYSYFHRARW